VAGTERDLLRELLSVEPGEFIATRTRLARAGARELVKVRKPPLKVWVANRAVTERPDSAGRLEDWTRRLRELEAAIAGGEKGAGAELREAAAAQRRELDTLESEAAKHARGAAADAREVIRRAAAAGGQAWQDLRDGVLLQEPVALEESVFGVAAADLPRPERASATDDAARRRRQEEARALRAEADRLAREAGEMENEARRARSRADAAEAKAAAADASLPSGEG